MIPLPRRAQKRHTETSVVAFTRVALNEIPRVRVFRNNCGEIHEPNRHLIYGLAPGSADLIGLARGRFLSVECKSEHGRATDDQRRWAALIRELGGIALEDIRSADQAVAELLAALS